MMEDLTGRKFGIITVNSFSHVKGSNYLWNCVCDCGKDRIVSRSNLMTGQTVSCGCYNIKTHTTHGMSKSSLYRVYTSMIQRCYYEKSINYNDWGGRGIVVCKEWKEDRTKFFNWCIKNGYKKGLQLDRKDNDLGYYETNCHFVTRKINCRNKRNNILITYKNEVKTLIEWCEIFNIGYVITKDRLKSGWSFEDAILFKKYTRNKKVKIPK